MASYHKEIYVFDRERPFRALIRNYRKEDFAGLIRIQEECFPPPFPAERGGMNSSLKITSRCFPKGRCAWRWRASWPDR